MQFNIYGLPFNPSGFRTSEQIIACLGLCNILARRMSEVEYSQVRMREAKTGKIEICELWHEPSCDLGPLTVYIGRSWDYVRGRGRVCLCNGHKFKVVQVEEFEAYNQGLAQYGVNLEAWLDLPKLRDNSLFRGSYV